VLRVVRSPVVLRARSGQRGRMLRVVPLKARYAGVIPLSGVVQIDARCAGRDLRRVWSRHATRNPNDLCRSAEHAHGDDRPPPHTRFGENGGLSSGGESRPAVMVGCSRPLRARDPSYFDTFGSALAAADGHPVRPHYAISQHMPVAILRVDLLPIAFLGREQHRPN
jgi:hypothetical protein